MAVVPTLTLNTAALMDEHDMEPYEPDEIRSLFRESAFGREFLKLLFEKASKNEWSPDASPNQSYLTVKTPFESRPYVFEIDWAMEIDNDTKDDISRDFLRIVKKIDTKDKIVDIAEEAFINVMKKQSPEDTLDESIIRKWKMMII